MPSPLRPQQRPHPYPVRHQRLSRAGERLVWSGVCGLLIAVVGLMFVPNGTLALNGMERPAGGRGLGQGEVTGTANDWHHPDPCVRAQAMVAQAGPSAGWIPVAGTHRQPQALRLHEGQLELLRGPGERTPTVLPVADVVNSTARPTPQIKQRLVLTLEWTSGGSDQWISCVSPQSAEASALMTLWRQLLPLQERAQMRAQEHAVPTYVSVRR